ncbi:MAG: sigma 54-interacting transcriptional regulator [Deltaproteobacteria bacterium]|nr:sigma 54-interacting transcriptional regulator [Deltaproteobacteria bacterium]
MISISGYQIEQELFRNARWVYYRATNNDTNEDVIVKSHLSNNPVLKELSQLDHEYNVLKGLKIPGVLQPVDKVEFTSGIALIFEVINAVPLDELLRKERLNVAEALQIALSLVAVIENLHRHNIIHKDIQPENIFIGPDKKEAWVGDCSVCSLLPKEAPNIQSFSSIDGNLAYISPEQTGRMNRPVDYRTDYYALGATLYEMLTGTVPFKLEDPLELVHSHLAKQPLPPNQIDRKIPNVVSEIVLKLLSKNAEERYQSAAGMRLDLENCIRQLNDTGFAERFTLGENDRPEKFQISQKLYGRDSELEILLRCFNGVTQGAFEFLTVAGYAGIGKTSLVRELYKPVTREKGYFITGKFDEFHKNIPYSALVSAFQELIGQILTENDDRLEQWQTRIHDALGDDSRVITEIIPDVEKLIGLQASIKPLGGDETQRRFNRIFLKFINVFCSANHPLVIFLDDLQWIDPASLELIDLMMNSGKLQYLLLIGAYRDNEVTNVHPLMMVLTTYGDKKNVYHNISLSPLQRHSVSEMIADSMKSNPKTIQPLANTVFTKTHGNPFFVNQFLTMLHQKKIIRKHGGGKSWEWDSAKIGSLDITDNVIDLLIYRLRHLPPESQNALCMAACIGFKFDLKTLSLITGGFPHQTNTKLKPAIQQEMIVSTTVDNGSIYLPVYDSQKNTWFRFQHDRIQQAAYSLVNTTEKKSIHLAIGKILLESMPVERIEEEVFDILSHLNFAPENIEKFDERMQLAELNLTAGLKAILTAAFEPAYRYLKMGLDLLPDGAWNDQYDLSLKLHKACIEAARLTGRFAEVEDLFRVVCRKSVAPLDTAGAYRSRIRAFMMQNMLSDAYNTAHEILNTLGEELPGAPSKEEIATVIEETTSLLGERPVEELLVLPRMNNPTKLMAMDIMSEVVSAVFIGVPSLFPHLICKQVRLSYIYGNTAASAFAYAAMGAILCRLFNDIEKGYRFGKLAVSLIRQLDAEEAKAKVLHAISGYINHWKEPIEKTMEMAMDGYRVAMKTGDFEFAGYNAYSFNKHALVSGFSLEKTEKNMTQFSAAIKHYKQETPFRFNAIFHQTALNLMGKSDDPVVLSGAAYDEHNMLSIHEEANDRLAIIYFRFCKLMLCTYFGRFPEGIHHADLLECELDGLPGGPMAYSLFYYFDALVRMALFDNYTEQEQQECLAKIIGNQKKMKLWSKHAPENYAQKYHLVEGELCRIQGLQDRAIYHYDQAISLSQKSAYKNDEALAYELSAKYWVSLGRQQFAKPFIRNAYKCYVRWGALSKTNQLHESFPAYLGDNDVGEYGHPKSSGPSDPFIEDPKTSGLDMATIIKATRAISSELVLDNLLVALMRHCIENAGAENGTLLLMEGGEPKIAVQGDVEGTERLFNPFIALDQGQRISKAIVNYTVRSTKPVVLNNACKRGMFTQDSYITGRKVRSVLCFPILYKAQLTGLLYLENTLLEGVFSADRIEVIKILSSQMSISIENAKYYEDRKNAEEEYRGIFENAVEGIYRTTPEGKFVDVNPAAAKIFGYETPDEIINNVKNIETQIYVNPEDRREFVSLLDKSEFVKDFEAPFYKKDGEIVWVSLNARKIVDEKGHLKFIEGFIKDVTIRKQTTDILIEQDEQLRRENILLRSKIKDRYKFGRLVGKSPLMQVVYELIVKAAATDENVIIYGESGTGKELVAKAIHEMSSRADKPFLTVNCGAIPENLLESEFFGYKKGAFTGAGADKKGYLDTVDKGTLFLDELGEIDPLMQVKLLRVLDGGGFKPVGGMTSLHPDIRIIAATNRNLKEAIREGRMREDFFYRIHVIPIQMPPLRERKEDILLLLEHFLKLKYPDELFPRIPGNVLDAMLAYDWPGNVREFQNTLYRYTTLNQLDFLSSQEREHKPFRTMGVAHEPIVPIVDAQGTLRDAVSAFEKEYILRLLEAHKWQRSRVAEQLGIDRKTLYRKIARYNL